MPRVIETQDEPLEACTVAAHRAYLDALIAWEGAIHRASCPICGSDDRSEDERSHHCEAAEVEKELRRVAFRDLCARLGFVPESHGTALPPENQACCTGVLSS